MYIGKSWSYMKEYNIEKDMVAGKKNLPNVFREKLTLDIFRCLVHQSTLFGNCQVMFDVFIIVA